MGSKRKLVQMTSDEVVDFLDSHWLMILGTQGPHGWPHLVTMGYGRLKREVAIQSYPSAQKIVNIRRDPRVTYLVEEGESYGEIRGVMVRGMARIIDDAHAAEAVAEDIKRRRDSSLPQESMVSDLKTITAKRVAIVIDAIETVSWDHRKLDGAY